MRLYVVKWAIDGLCLVWAEGLGLWAGFGVWAYQVGFGLLQVGLNPILLQYGLYMQAFIIGLLPRGPGQTMCLQFAPPVF